MRTIIAGSRDSLKYSDLELVINLINWNITSVISGGARGADALGERWASENNIPLQIFKADWNHYGKKAGLIRNIEMSNNAQALIALWNGTSTGTKHMIDVAKKKGLVVYVYRTDGVWGI